MCGRYALALRPSQIRRMLEANDMAVWDAPEDDGDDAPRGSYNFAPGYHGVVYRADVPDYGAGPRRQRPGPGSSQEDARGDDQAPAADDAPLDDEADHAPETPASKEPRYILSTMKWGLVPFWTKRNPDYATVLRTINCRDDSLAASGGMWASMKGRKRCVVVAQGFYEWLKTGPKERVPHYIRRRDGHLLLLAGLWDVVQYDDDGEPGRKHYTYTIVTTDSSAPLKFLHDRMPVVLDPGSAELRAWLDPGRYEWNRELQSILRPWGGELDVDAVTKDVNKVGGSSPNFIVPVASRENKSNIANFFANAKAKPSPAKGRTAPGPEGAGGENAEVESAGSAAREAGDSGTAPSSQQSAGGVKRGAESPAGSPPKKTARTTTPKKAPPAKAAAGARPKISATSNGTKSPSKAKSDGSQKITRFFANSA